MSSASDEFCTIASLTSDTEAAQVLDIRASVALKIVHEVVNARRREHYIFRTDAGLWRVSYGSGGGLYYCDETSPGRVAQFAKMGTRVTVVKDPTPAAVQKRVTRSGAGW